MMNEARIRDILRGVIDPDIGINIVDLGLVEHVETGPDGVRIGLIMTTPACPQTGYLRDECQHRLADAGITAEVAVLEMPLWEPDRMTDTAKRAMGWDG